MTSSTASNFTQRLSSLADSASKETIQTLSKYMSFHRKKHGSALASALLSAIESAPTSSRKVLYLSVAHEVLVANSSPTVGGGGDARKWERTADFRTLLGEALVVPAAESIRDAAAAEEDGGGDSARRVRDMADAWEESGAFGGPTIADGVRRALDAPPRRTGAEAAAAAVEEEEKEEKEGSAEPKEEEAGAGGRSGGAEAEPPEARGPSSPPSEAGGLPSGDGPSAEAEGAAAAAAAARAGDEKTGPPAPPTAAKDGGGEGGGGADAGGAAADGAAAKEGQGKAGAGTPPPSPAVESASDAAVDEEGKPLAPAFTAGDDDGGGGDGKAAAAAKAAEGAGGSRTPPPEEEAFDFEAEGIEPGRVEARELLEPCKSLATLQIARDLRNDTTVQLSTILGSVSEEAMEACRRRKAAASAAADGGDGERAAAGEEEDGAPALPDDVLDLDLDDALSSVREYRDIISRQREARKALIYLLIKSRCKFGSDESAEAFVAAAGTVDKLRKRSAMLRDAMELEGLDVVEGEEDGGGDDGMDGEDGSSADLAPLEWYKPRGGGEEPPADTKRARVG